jgi:hypothetical protein
MAPLSQELFDAIIDEIHDKETLKSCALVATSFLLPSQRNLFRNLTIRLGLGGQRSRDTSAALAESPHLMSYIRNLTIYMGCIVSEYLAVAVILRSVQSIESLAVFERFRNWRLGDEASSALLDCLSRPSLRRLELSNVSGVPAALILAATAIPVVEFKSVSMAHLVEDISEQLHVSAPVPRLRHLIFGDPNFSTPEVLRVCNLLLHPDPWNPAYTQIERLEINIDQRGVNYDERIMAAFAATLKYLVLHNKGMSLCLYSE